MRDSSSRREFLASGIALPAAALTPTLFPIHATDESREIMPGTDAAKGLAYRTLGKTGLKATSVGFGCMITSDPSVIAKAVDLGINYFDTARGYQHGNNERMVGAALGDRRKGIFVSSKSEAGDKKSALADLETSLRELRTDYLDIWYLHSKDEPESLNAGLLEAVQTAKAQGKARFVGLSTHSAETMVPAAIRTGILEVVLITYNYTMGSRLDAAIGAAAQAGLGVVAMKVMAHGKKDLKPGAGPAALKWVLKNQGIQTTIPSMVDMDQLEQNFRAMSSSFDAADQTVLTACLDQLAPVYCRMCGGCRDKCPKGLPVADMLRCLTYADGYGQFALGRERFQGFTAGIRSVRCVDCGSCAVDCPNGVQVSRRLSLAQTLFA
jgi:aryl-alcohol dehydrogenase-like predicted oxidoreductase